MDWNNFGLWFTALIGGIPTIVIGIRYMIKHVFPLKIEVPESVKASYSYDDKGNMNVSIQTKIGFHANCSTSLGNEQIEIDSIRIGSNNNPLEMMNENDNKTRSFLDFEGHIPEDNALRLKLIDRKIIKGRIRVKRWCKSRWFNISPLPQFEFEIIDKTK